MNEQDERNNYFSHNRNSSDYSSGTKPSKKQGKDQKVTSINTKIALAHNLRSNSKSNRNSDRTSLNGLRSHATNFNQRNSIPVHKFSYRSKQENLRQQESHQNSNQNWYDSLKNADTGDFFDSNSIHHPNYWTDINALRNFMISPRTRTLDKNRKTINIPNTKKDRN